MSTAPYTPPPQRAPAPQPAPSAGRVGCLVLLPLAAALLSVPWFLMVIVPVITEGARTTQGANMRALGVLAMVPAVAGLVAGIAIGATGRARSVARMAWLLIGCALCVVVVLAFAGEVLR